ARGGGVGREVGAARAEGARGGTWLDSKFQKSMSGGMATASWRLSGVASPAAKWSWAVTMLPLSRPEAASCWFLVARRRTVNVPAALKVAFTDDPVAGGAPPSKFQLRVSRVPFPEKAPVPPASSAVGAPVIVPFGRVSVAVAVWEVIRPLVHAEKGRNWLAGMVVPFSVTASELGSKVHVASSLTLIDPLVTRLLCAGLGAMKLRGPGAGSARTAGARRRKNPRMAKSQRTSCEGRASMARPLLPARPATMPGRVLLFA